MADDTDFCAARRYLLRGKSWVDAESDTSKITTDDLFQTSELMFLAHLCTAEDTDRQLKKNKLGRIHQRLLYIAVKKPGRTVGEILSYLRVTNQNIHKPLGDLVNLGLVEQRTSKHDRRKRQLFATPSGEEMFEDLMQLQFERYRKVYDAVGKDAVQEFWKVLWHILDDADQRWLLNNESPG